MQSMKLIEDDIILTCQPLLIKALGRSSAQFLSQLHYWINKSKTVGVIENGTSWIYNSAENWAKQLCLSTSTIKRVINLLKEKKIIEVKQLSNNKYNHVNYFTISYKNLETLVNPIGSFCTNGPAHNDPIYIQRLHNKNNNISNHKKINLDGVGQGVENSIENVDVEVTSIQSTADVVPIPEPKTIGSKTPKPKTNNYTKKIPMNELNDENEAIELKAQKQLSRTKQTQISDAMLEIWNKRFSIKAPAHMSKSLKEKLLNAFENKFKSNLDEWQTYVDGIFESSYLMGENFNLSIFWAVNLNTIERIFCCEFGVTKYKQNEGSKVILKEFEKTKEEVIQEIENIEKEPQKAKDTRLLLLRAIGHVDYYLWFHNACYVVDEHNNLKIAAHNPYAEKIWAERFSKFINF